MKLQSLEKRSDLDQNNKLKKKFIQFELLINELRNKEASPELVNFINDQIKMVNECIDSDRGLKNQVRKSQLRILKKVEKELKLVVKNHYRNMWLGVGMALGIAIGSALGTGTGNMSMLALGLPLGMAIGIAYGTSLDKKAKEEGNQLNLDLN